MGSAIPGKSAEVSLLYHKDLTIKHRMETDNYILYKVYIDGILTIFDSRKTNEKEIFSEKNKTHRNFQLKLSQQDHNTNFLYLKLNKHPEHLHISIDRKLTIKNKIIRFKSKHPVQKKSAAYRSYSPFDKQQNKKVEKRRF